MKDRPIIFSAPMVRALLEGRKTQTRRVAKTYPYEGSCTGHVVKLSRDRSIETDWRALPFCPYGQPGDRLWVRETFARRLDVDPAEEPEKAKHYALYRADGTGLDEPHWHSYPQRWTSSIHMPRWASRITLEITEVRVERANSISPEDAKSEGIEAYAKEHKLTGYWTTAFSRLWDEINTKPGIRWEDNPWLWAISFRRVESE